MPTTTVPVPTPPEKCRLCLPNELLSELVDWLPMAQFVGDTTMATSPPRFGASQMCRAQAQGKMRNVALIVYLDRARHKFEKAAQKMADQHQQNLEEDLAEFRQTISDKLADMDPAQRAHYLASLPGIVNDVQQAWGASGSGSAVNMAHQQHHFAQQQPNQFAQQQPNQFAQLPQNQFDPFSEYSPLAILPSYFREQFGQHFQSPFGHQQPQEQMTSGPQQNKTTNSS